MNDCSRKAPVHRMLRAVMMAASHWVDFGRSAKCRNVKALLKATVAAPQKALKRFALRAASTLWVNRRKIWLRIAQVGAPGEWGSPLEATASENSPLSWKEIPGAAKKARRGNATEKTATVSQTAGTASTFGATRARTAEEPNTTNQIFGFIGGNWRGRSYLEWRNKVPRHLFELCPARFISRPIGI